MAPAFSLTRRGALISAAAAGSFTALSAPITAAREVRDDVGSAQVQVKRFYVDSRFGQLHGYRAEPETISTKTPLICLHQTPSSAKIFKDFIAVMGQDRLVMAFDNPGYGSSDGPVDRVPLETYSETLAETLETLGFGPNGRGPVDILGMLTGAKIGGELARSRPDMVRRLILVQSLVMTEAQRLAMIARLQGGVHKGWAEQGADFYVTRLKSALAELDSEQTLDQAITDFADSLVAGEDYLRGGMTALAYPTERLYKEITRPTLVVALGDERAELAAGAADLIPQAQLLRLPSYSRHTFRSDPDAMAAPFRAFLDSP